MSDNTDQRDDTGKDEHGRDVQLEHEKTDPEEARDEDGLTEEEKEAREREDEADRKRDIEEGSTEREDDARDNTNPDNHRDEEPFNS